MPFNSSEIDEIRSIVQDQLRKGLRNLPQDSLFPNQIFGADRKGSVLTSSGTGAEWSDDTEWIMPVLKNGWVEYSDLYRVRYRRKNGIVYLRGLIKNGTMGVDAFVIPKEFLPVDKSSRRIFATNTHSYVFGSVEFDSTTGTVSPVTGNNNWVSLDGIFWEVGNKNV